MGIDGKRLRNYVVGMAQSHHTPAPWTVGHFVDINAGEYEATEQGVYEIEEANEQINDLRGDGQEDKAEAVADANVRIITAAPGMFRALETALLFHSSGHWDDMQRSRWHRLTGSHEATARVLCDTVRAAMAVANGQEVTP